MASATPGWLAAGACAGAALVGVACGRESWRRGAWLCASACALALCAAAAPAGDWPSAAARCLCLALGFAAGRRAAVVGLTGGIGAGKSALASALRAAAPEVVLLDADVIAREAVAPGSAALAALAAAFGPAALRADGALDRAWLRARIAGDAAARATVNGITHPAIARAMLWAVATHRWLRGRTVVLDAALLYEAGTLYRALCRPVIVVVAPDEARVERVRRRDGCDADAARAMLAAQMPQARKAALADVDIDNSGDAAQLAAAAANLAHQLRSPLWWW